MARKKKGHSNDTDELWSRTFDENEGYTNGNYSRTERKRADKAISPVLKSLWIFLALFIILPTSAYLFYTHNAQNTSGPEPETEKLVVKENKSDQSESSKVEESKSESEVSESEETVESESEQSEAASSEPESVESSKAVESESQPVQESTVSEESTEIVESQSTSTYTVKAGDNLYRIALNHGMSTDQLKSLNGLTTDEVTVGATLVVN